ncbi:GNAT family N-acetyltransferase [Paenibacillus sp. JMULE4]|uniref:GNAT family N-acetyltransferase n=1 Tax=Paenibacillus sp. JMULE4 TaxID=2518342 RepID=UPI0015758613|nr:GNAT family N-acetyltransferase [Paenibacillus sp. JMULE4]
MKVGMKIILVEKDNDVVKFAFKDVTLSEATLNEFEFMFNLKCEKNILYWGGFADKPNYKNLKEWYYRILLDKTKKILFINYYGEKVGYITYKIYNDSICDDFSIAVSDRFSGKGIATKAIGEMIEYLKYEHFNCKTFYSYIREDNIPSQKVHRKNNFILTDQYEDKFLQSDNKIVRLHKWVKNLEE